MTITEHDLCPGCNGSGIVGNGPRAKCGMCNATGRRLTVAEINEIREKRQQEARIQGAPSKRVAIMEKGIGLTSGDRNKTYGSPHPNLTTFAHLVNSYLKGLGWEGPKLDSVDGSMIMVLAKVSRVAVNKQHEDNYVDGSTYFAIAGECADKNAVTTKPNWVEDITAAICELCCAASNPSYNESMKCFACGRVFPPKSITSDTPVEGL